MAFKYELKTADGDDAGSFESGRFDWQAGGTDGTFTLTLQSDGSTTSGPLTGVFCNPGYSGRKGAPHS